MDDDQERVLEDAKRNIKEQAFYVRQAIESAKLRDCLKHAANMLNELKTDKLSPKNYYMIFMQVFDEMRAVEAAFKEEYKRGRKMSDLYENVQHATGIIARLYLLVTVGSVYISTREVPAKDLLSDLMEMMKGIQHPVKGLFLRYFFLKLCKDKLPDKGSEYEGEGGDFNDAITVILNNLSEMNKLWTRVQSSGNKERSKKDKERNDLKVIIGENLVRLSQLEGCTIEIYKEQVLDKILEIVLAKDDKISQQYLMDCIIQAFPDEYHIETLEKILQTCGQIMLNGVDVKTIFIRLMDRLADFVANAEEEVTSLANLDLYDLFKKNIDRIIESQGASLELSKFLELQVAFLKFCSQLYPENVGYVNDILKSCCILCQKQNSIDIDEESLKNIVKLLTLPLDSMSIAVLQMDEFPKLMIYLPFLKRRTVSLKICEAIIHSAIPLDNLEIVNQIISFIRPLLRDETDTVALDAYELEQEQQIIGRLIHLAIHQNPDQYFIILEAFRNQVYEGGPKRQFYTLPAAFFAYVKLAKYTHQCAVRREEPTEEEEEETTEQQTAKKFYDQKRKYYKGEFDLTFSNLFPILKEFIEKLVHDHSDLALKLYLEFIQIINHCDTGKELDEHAYDLFTQVLEIYQNDVADAEQKILLIAVITACLNTITSLGEENYDGLAGNTASYSSKLLKKWDQCLAVLNSSHLFYSPAMKNETRVMECFKKALKIADANFSAQANSKNLHLYIAILNKFLYYFAQEDFNLIKAEDVNKCIDMIKQKLDKVPEKTHLYLNNTFEYIQTKKKESSRFADIVL